MAIGDDIPMHRKPRFGQPNTVNRMHALYRFVYEPPSHRAAIVRQTSKDITDAIALAVRAANDKARNEGWKCYGSARRAWISMEAGVFRSDVDRYFGDLEDD